MIKRNANDRIIEDMVEDMVLKQGNPHRILRNPPDGPYKSPKV